MALNAFTHARDSAGNPTSVSDWQDYRDYTHDVNNRLDSWEYAEDYGYDWVGNRLNPPAGQNAMQYNAADQLVLWPGQHQYQYNSDGSLYRQLDSAYNAQKVYDY